MKKNSNGRFGSERTKAGKQERKRPGAGQTASARGKSPTVTSATAGLPPRKLRLPAYVQHS